MKKIDDIDEFNQIKYVVVENNIIRSVDKNKFLLLMNVAAIGLLVVLFVLQFIVFRFEMILVSSDYRYVWLFLYALFFIPFHEFLHGITFHLFGSVPRNRIKFGLILKQGLAYCISLDPVPVRAARLSLMMPIYIGVVPIYIIGFLLKDHLFLMVAHMCLVGSVGDFYYIWKLRRAKPHQFMFEEMPSKSGYEIGYILYEKKDAIY